MEIKLSTLSPHSLKPVVSQALGEPEICPLQSQSSLLKNHQARAMDKKLQASVRVKVSNITKTKEFQREGVGRVCV